MSSAVAASLCCLSVFASCEADKINADPSLMLEFSTDTVAFDTIFTGDGSTTKMFKVYNRSGNKLLISEIALSDGSHYRVNLAIAKR